MTIDELKKIYEQTNNKRGLELIKKLNDNCIVRFLENEEDDKIFKDFQKLNIWVGLKARSYINNRGHWVIIPTKDKYFSI